MKNRAGSVLITLLWLSVLILFRYRATSVHWPLLDHVLERVPALPLFAVGHSYMALRCLSFAADLHNGKLQKTCFLSFLGYLFFVPAFVAGPIDRYSRFTIDMQNIAGSQNTENLAAGLHRIIIGFFKKTVLAQWLAQWALTKSRADSFMTEPVSMHHLWLALYAYSIMIYLDFSAYSDMAIGTGLLLGIRLPENFQWPYFRRNLIDFWNHWHMTLTSWLRDYLFTPICQRLFRISTLRSMPLLIATLSYLITMLFCGFWHGMTFNFLLWGLYHGAGLSACKAFQWFSNRTRWPDSFRAPLWSRIGLCLSTIITFHFVTFGWLFFEDAGGIFQKLVGIAR